MGRAALLTSIYFWHVDVIGRPIANKGRINGASLKAAGSLLPGHGLITVSLAFALIGGNKGSEVEWMEGISISIIGRGHKVLSNLRLYTPPLTLQIHTHRATHNTLSVCVFFLILSLISYSKYTQIHVHIYFLLVSGTQSYWNEVGFQKTETETLHSKGIYRQPVLYHENRSTFWYSLDLNSGIFSITKEVARRHLGVVAHDIWVRC